MIRFAFWRQYCDCAKKNGQIERGDLVRTKGEAVLIDLERADEALNEGSQEEEGCRL